MADVQDGEAWEEVFEGLERSDLVVGDVQVVEVFEFGSFGQRDRLNGVVREDESLLKSEATCILGRFEMKLASRRAFLDRSSVCRYSSALRSLGLTSAMQFSLTLISVSYVMLEYLEVAGDEAESFEQVAVQLDGREVPQLLEVSDRG